MHLTSLFSWAMSFGQFQCAVPFSVNPMNPNDVYTQPPTSIPRTTWTKIAPIVCDIIATYCTAHPPTTVSHYKALRAAVTKHIAYCHNTGCDLNYQYIFDDEIIEQSVHSHTNAATSSKSRTRRLLKIIAQHLNPDFDGPRMYHRYERNDPNPPYTTKEIHNIWQWANTTDKRGHTKQLIVACGLGAGLTAKETGHLTGADIKIDNLGVMLHLPDRTVPVLNEWDEAFRTYKLEQHPDSDYILCPQSARRNQIISERLSVIGTVTGIPQPNMRRMRTTWIVEHLNNHVPDAAICAAAGIKTLKNYEHYRPDTTSVEKYRSLLHRAPVAGRGGLVVIH